MSTPPPRDDGEMPSAAVQDYAKALYVLGGGGAVATTTLAARLGVAPGSVSGMLRRLAALGLVEHELYRGARLTVSGRRLALEVLRRHRLLELLLVESLGMGWDEVHAEAEVLEHAVSEPLAAAIAARLGDPAVDPHGDPIPSRELQLEERPGRELGELEPGERATLVRVDDADPAMLRYLADRGIALGTELELVERHPFDGPLSVRVGGDVHLLGAGLARAMRLGDGACDRSHGPAVRGPGTASPPAV